MGNSLNILGFHRCVKCGDTHGKDTLHCRNHNPDSSNICNDCNYDLNKYYGCCYHRYT